MKHNLEKITTHNQKTKKSKINSRSTKNYQSQSKKTIEISKTTEKRATN